ncbi:hypothetical protein LSH36_473g02005 [Paralvinella palmiformis]|uniref:Uncharacterized protein n=1 Tax=Paralvinella palmiformis TaxID=53620 RepID=A0AAD9JA21_9ANNE|nr:hypothetical protein LSH36_473g02005 [Paralvinella palmiformis]
MTTVNNHGETNIFAPLTLTRTTSGPTSSTDMTFRAHFLTILESTLVYERGQFVGQGAAVGGAGRRTPL